MTTFRHRSLVAFSLALATLALTIPAAAQIEYELFIIEPWNQTYSLATSSVVGLNNLNQVTGCAHTDPLGGPCSFLWTLEGGKQPINVAGPINDQGVIVITNYIRWPNGTLQEMDGAMSGAADLNNSNVVVGSDGSVGTCPKPPPHVNREATVWSQSTGTILVDQQLGVLSADQAWAINNNNQFVGVKSSTGHCGDQKAFYYDLNANQYVDLHTLLVGQPSGITHAVDINDAGMVIGDGPSNIGGGAFLWSASAGFTFFPELPGTLSGYSIPSSINNHGTVVGQAIINEEWRAWIWDEKNGIRDLNVITEGIPANFVIEESKVINDNGWIIGRGHYGAWSPERAVVLIPLTKPIPGDLNGDGKVDQQDLGILLASYGLCAGQPGFIAAADIDKDGCVGQSDLGILLANYSG